MTLIHLRTLLDHLGVELTARGDKLHYKAAAGVLTPEVKAALAAHKAALLATLAGTDGPGPPPADRGWRRAVATWPVEWRERWGRRANELQDHGEPWDASEWIAFNELAPDSVRGFLPGFAYQCGAAVAGTVAYIEAIFADHMSYAMAMALTAVTVFTFGAIVAWAGKERRGVAFGEVATVAAPVLE